MFIAAKANTSLHIRPHPLADDREYHFIYVGEAKCRGICMRTASLRHSTSYIPFYLCCGSEMSQNMYANCVTPSLRHSTTYIHRHSVTPSLRHTVTPPHVNTVTLSLRYYVTPSLRHTVTPSLHHIHTPSRRQLVDLKPEQDERYRLRINVFPGT